MSLGMRIRTLRKALGLTQQGLADRTQVSRIYIQALESNRRTPSMKLLSRLAEALEVEVQDLVKSLTASSTGRLQLEEVLHRRRASATPVSSVFAELLGLDLRPRLVRDAKNLWAAVEHHRGAEGRDAVWRHPDLLPTAGHLADPLSFAAGESRSDERVEDDMDAELRRLLEGPGA